MYILKNNENKLITVSDNKEKLEAQLSFYPESAIEETDIEYKLTSEGWKTPEEFEDYNKEQLYNLSLTRADVLLALYDKFSLTPEAIRAKLSERDQIRFDYAQNFYRGDESVIALATELGVSDDDLNYLFKNKSFPTSEE